MHLSLFTSKRSKISSMICSKPIQAELTYIIFSGIFFVFGLYVFNGYLILARRFLRLVFNPIICYLFDDNYYIHLYGVYFLYVLNIVLQYLPNRKYCCTVSPVNSKKGIVGFKRKTALGPYLRLS